MAKFKYINVSFVVILIIFLYTGLPQEIKFILNENFYLPLENRTEYESIRLVDGATEFEGRLEVNISGEFGTVCNDVRIY